jgi:hypothetical protein
MSTMAGNGLLMKALMSLRKKLANNTIDSKEYKELLKLAQFGNGILHWNKANPFTQNYAQFIDNVNNPKILAKQIRVKPKDWSMAKDWSIAFKMATKILQLQSKLSLFRKII